MTLKTALQLKTASAIWQKAVKTPSRLAELLVRAIPLVVGGQSRSWVKAAFHFAHVVNSIRKSQGSKGAALWMKANTLLIQRLVSGAPLRNPREAGPATSVTRRGVPRWIPIVHRRAIVAGSLPVIRLYLGFLSLYRVMEFKGKLTLATVTDGPTVDPRREEAAFGGFIPTFFAYLSAFGVKPIKAVRDREDSEYWGQPNGLRGAIRFPSLSPMYKWMFTSGPNSKYTKVLAVGNAWTDMIAIVSRPWLLGTLEAWNSFVGHCPFSDLPFYESVEQTGRNWSESCWKAQSKGGATPKWSRSEPWAGQEQFDVGALSVVEEPGKKRIVAMVDIWTQWALYPLHRFIFDKVLRKIPQDGTFDQQKPIQALLEGHKKSGKKHLWSYDLSAATDRLPIGLQVLVLAGLSHLGFASCWRDLLVDRPYRTPKEYSTTHGPGHQYVKYAVGQPMGAYSSWAMLAITHHALVQFAAWRAGHRAWFTEYAVLGDDVVIGDGKVAAQYVSVMKSVGVKIGFHKSIVSNNGSCEFAKRFYYKGVEVSPLSLAGVAVGWLGPGFIPEVVASSEGRHGKTLSLYQIARYMGVGYRAASGATNKLLTKLPRILTSAFLLMLRPGAPRGARTLYDWYLALTMSGASRGKLRTADEEKFLVSLWEESMDSVLGPAFKRLNRILVKLIYPRSKAAGAKKPDRDPLQLHPLGGDESRAEYHRWFKNLVVSRFMRSYNAAIDRAGDCLRESKKVWAVTGELRNSLKHIELALAELALIPMEVSLTRRETIQQKVDDRAVLGVLLPRSVKRWKRLDRFVVRKAPASQKRRVLSAPLPFTRVILRG